RQDSEKQRHKDTFNALHEFSTIKINTATNNDAVFGASVPRISLNEKKLSTLFRYRFSSQFR
ncbi:hypothetical protein, partial [Citrobacter freundii]|uniref:hypothetical protein n=1 Tax=Citrobacter freundii TaxID=546 RepID=UPI000738B17D